MHAVRAFTRRGTSARRRVRRYGLLFVAIGLAAALLSVVGRDAWSWPLAWLGADLIAVGLAYLTNYRAIFGKRDDGSLGAARVVIFLPFLLITWGAWHVVRVVSREPVVSRLKEDLLLSRRLLADELPEDVHVVIDLTAEFAEPRAMRRPGRYCLFPILDAGVPDPRLLEHFFARLPPSTTLLVHCAQGHGRTALVAACLLLDRGLASSAEAAVGAVLSARPGAQMNRVQRAFVESYARTRALVRT